MTEQNFKEELIIWNDPSKNVYYLDCARRFIERKKSTPGIQLITRLNVPCDRSAEVTSLLNLKNLCVLPDAYQGNYSVQS